MQLDENSSAPYGDLQAHKKTLCVVGILHCPSSVAGAAADYAAFLELLRTQYPHALVHRCFVMEPVASQPEVQGVGGALMDIPVCSEDKTRFYFLTLMQDFTYALLRQFEVVFARRAVEPPYLATPLDGDLNERALKALQGGRLNKLKGDYCLLAGSPGDALPFFMAAKEQCRAKSDWIWLAGALEGFCSALLAQSKVCV